MPQLQEKREMMLSFKTLVALGVIIPSLISLNASGETQPTDCARAGEKAAEAAAAGKSDAEVKKLEDLQARCQARANKGELSDSCSDSEAAFNKAKGELVEACKAAGATDDKAVDASGNAVAGAIACGVTMAKCGCRVAGMTDTQRTTLGCPDFEDPKNSRIGRYTSNRAPHNLKKAQADIDICPIVAKEVVQELQTQVDRLGPLISTYQEKARTARDAKVKADQEAQTAIDKVDQQITEAKNKYEQEVANQALKKSERVNANTRELYALNIKLTEAKGNLVMIKDKKQDVELERTRRLNGLEVRCIDEATTRSLKRQEELVAKAKTGQLLLGDQSKVIAAANRSIRDLLKIHYQSEFARCMNENRRKDLESGDANEQYRRALAAVDAEVKNANATIQDIRNSISEIKSPDGCTGTSATKNEPADCRIWREAKAEAKRQERAYNGEMQTLDKLRTSTMNSTEAAKKAASTALAEADGAYKIESARLQNVQQMLAIQSSVPSTTAEAKKALDLAYGKLSRRATAIVACSNPTVAEGTISNCHQNGSACNQAYNFLNVIGLQPTAYNSDGTIWTPGQQPAGRAPSATPATGAPASPTSGAGAPSPTGTGAR